jgi:hypothetical protein
VNQKTVHQQVLGLSLHRFGLADKVNETALQPHECINRIARAHQLPGNSATKAQRRRHTHQRR